ncbi:MAG TPA: HAD-IA family hydrolase [Candidatus Binatus sp.]|nr:HAD-IA family hydrolase [Candidatus Binatus sp.]
MKKAVDLVMFDLDGTLADSGHDLASSVNFTRAHFKLSPLPENLVYANVGRGVEHLLKQSFPEEGADQFSEVMRVFLVHYEIHLLDRTTLYPGVHDALKYFLGKRRLVVSNKLRRLTLAVVRGLGVADEFDDILGGDSASEKKPHPALLQMALDKFRVPAARALMVGDGDTDIEAGKRAGVITCGVTYGLGNHDDLVAAKPDFMIDELNALENYFC